MISNVFSCDMPVLVRQLCILYLSSLLNVYLLSLGRDEGFAMRVVFGRIADPGRVTSSTAILPTQLELLLLPPPPPPPPMFHLQSYSCSCGDAQDAWVSSQLFIEQYHLTPFEPHLRPFDNRLSMCVGSTERTTALHFPQLGLQHRIHSTSDLFFRPRVTADDDSLVSALSAVRSFFVQSFRNAFNGSSVPSLYDSSNALMRRSWSYD